MTRSNSPGSAIEPPNGFKEKVLLSALYVTAVTMGLSLAALADAGALYALEQYFVQKYGSPQIAEKAHTYSSVSFAVFGLGAAIAHFYAVMFINRMLEYRRMKHYGFALGCVVCLIVAMVMVSDAKFSSKTLALVPVMAAFVLGGYMGGRVPLEENPFRKLKPKD